jgi:D-inositol-3-phosphate glycosyltransferase
MSTTRTLIVSHYYPPHIGGIEYVAYNQATRLAAHGARVTVVTSRTAGDPKSGVVEGVNVIRVAAYNGLEAKAIPFPIFSPMLLVRLWQATRKADIVHIHDVFYISSLCAAIVASVLRKPIVVTQHVAMVSHASRFTTIIEKFVYMTTGRWILGRALAVMIINTRVRDFLIGLGVPANKLIAMNNGVDTERFHQPNSKERMAARKAFGLPAQAFVVLFIGRFVHKKGFDSMRHAESSDYLTVFAGGETKRLPTKNQRFLGKLDQAHLAQLYHAADLFVLPSDSEGFPLTAQEAMASGVPVALKYDAGYDRYHLTGKQVAFLLRADKRELQQLIQELMKDANRRTKMAQEALRYVQSHFSWDSHIEMLNKLYTEVI